VKSPFRTPNAKTSKLSLLMTTAIIAGFGMAPMAYAQDASDDLNADDEDVVVTTGIRQALKEARDLKRDADTAVDSITASDVSTLPDLNVADALARIPGVVAQRFNLADNNGGDFPSTEGGNNLIRGLSFVRSEFNGRETFSANGGRALDFGTVAPELIGSVNVYKNVTADLTEGGIGGTIDLRTLEPFDKPDRFIAATADLTYGDFRESFSPDLTVTAGDRWDTANGEFGLLGSFAHSELDTRLDNFQLAQLAPLNSFELDPNNPFDVTTSDEFFAVPLGYQLRTNEIDRDRQSYYISGQYQNNADTFKATAKYFRIENENQRVERTTEYFASAEQQLDGGTRIVAQGADLGISDIFSSTAFSSEGIAGCATSTAGFANNSCTNDGALPFRPVVGLYESGVISNSFRDWTNARGARFQNTAINTDNQSTTEDMSLNVQWKPAEDWYVTLDGHRTNSKFEEQQLWGVTNFYSDFSFSGIGNGFPEITLVPDAGNNTWRRFADRTTVGPGWTGATPAVNPAPIPTDFSDLASTFHLAAADSFSDNEGTAWAVKGDVRKEFNNDGWFDAIQFGARVSEREQTNRSAGLNWGSISPAWAGEFGSTHVQTSETQLGGEVVDFSDFFGGGVFAEGSQSAFVFTPTEILADYDAYVNAIFTDDILFTNNGEIGFQNQVVNGSTVNPVTGQTGAFSGSWNPLLQNGVVDYDNRGTNNSVLEAVNAIYARLDFGNEFDNGMSLDGNIGLRYAESTVSGDGGIDYVPITGEVQSRFTPEAIAFFNQPNVDESGKFNTVENWLPSLNAKLNLNDESLVRLAVSKNITRPNINQLNPGRTRVPVQAFPTAVDPETGQQEVVDVINISVNEFGGNPNLLPIESWNYDLGFEHYWGDENYFSITGFYKDISNNITSDIETLEFVTLDGDNTPILFIGDQNQDDATFKGVEVAYQHFYDELPGLLSNLGIQANYTYIDADTNAPVAVIDSDGDGQPDSDERIYRFGVDNFLGTSEHTANLVGIYQDEQFEFRLAYNWRSDYLISYTDFITGNPIFVDSEGFLDGSAKWDINDNLQVRFQVSNILGQEGELYQQIDAAGQNFERATFKSDRRIKFGVRVQY
jgi:TonB-dependent receptor